MKFIKTAKLAAIIAVLVVAASACTSPWAEQEPVGTGIGTDEFKKSPCACLSLPQSAPDASLLRRLQG